MTLNETVANQYARKKDNGRDGTYLLERNNRLAELKAAEIAAAMGSADNSFDKITDVKIPEYLDSLKRKITDEKVYAHTAIALSKLNEELKEGPREQLRKLEALAEENIEKTNSAAKEYKKADGAVTAWYIANNTHDRLQQYIEFGTPKEIENKIAEFPKLRETVEKYFKDTFEEEPVKILDSEKEPKELIRKYQDAKKELQEYDYSSIDKSIESANTSLESFKSRIEAAAQAMKKTGVDEKIVDETLKEISTLLYESKDSPQEKLRILKERIQERFNDIQTNNKKKIDENDQNILSWRETLGKNLSEITPYEKFGTVDALNRRLDRHTEYSGLCKLIEETKSLVDELNSYRDIGSPDSIKKRLDGLGKLPADWERRLTIEDWLVEKPIKLANDVADRGRKFVGWGREYLLNPVVEKSIDAWQANQKRKQEAKKAKEQLEKDIEELKSKNNIKLRRGWLGFESLPKYKARIEEKIKKSEVKPASGTKTGEEKVIDAEFTVVKEKDAPADPKGEKA